LACFSWFAGICEDNCHYFLASWLASPGSLEFVKLTAIIPRHHGLLLLIRWHLTRQLPLFLLALWLASPDSLAFDKATSIDRWHYGLPLLVRWHLICNCHYSLALLLASPGSLAFNM
jgi:hypothetical protein